MRSEQQRACTGETVQRKRLSKGIWGWDAAKRITQAKRAPTVNYSLKMCLCAYHFFLTKPVKSSGLDVHRAPRQKNISVLLSHATFM